MPAVSTINLVLQSYSIDGLSRTLERIIVAQMPILNPTTLKEKEDERLAVQARFLGIKNRLELADFLQVPLKQLTYLAYGLPDTAKYTEFTLKKRSGKNRKIQAPINALKKIQRKLCHVLNASFYFKTCVHGFIDERSIVSNAKIHVKRKHVLNVDLKDFFPTIIDKRVYGLFASKPFNFEPEVSSLLTRICCCSGFLPQGAPTSPVISNLICYKLDNQLLEIATKNRCNYSRYADDITISTNLSEFY